MSIRMQADDFLIAYKTLKENYDTATLVIMGPSVVCLAFSLELYIKDLHFVINDKAPRGHNILKLYEELPQKTKEEIFSHESISQNPFTTRGDLFSPKKYTGAYTAYDGFIDEIKAISAGFEKWRYSYENKALCYDVSFALALIGAIKSTADNARKQSNA